MVKYSIPRWTVCDRTRPEPNHWHTSIQVYTSHTRFCVCLKNGVKRKVAKPMYGKRSPRRKGKVKVGTFVPRLIVSHSKLEAMQVSLKRKAFPMSKRRKRRKKRLSMKQCSPLRLLRACVVIAHIYLSLTNLRSSEIRSSWDHTYALDIFGTLSRVFVVRKHATRGKSAPPSSCQGQGRGSVLQGTFSRAFPAALECSRPITTIAHYIFYVGIDSWPLQDNPSRSEAPATRAALQGPHKSH